MKKIDEFPMYKNVVCESFEGTINFLKSNLSVGWHAMPANAYLFIYFFDASILW